MPVYIRVNKRITTSTTVEVRLCTKIMQCLASDLRIGILDTEFDHGTSQNSYG